MQVSILIVSKNRRNDLLSTLLILEKLINKTQVEVLVFLDGCTDNSEDLCHELKWVRWFESSKSIGASSARHQIYPLAKSEILIGLDDDAHPLTIDFLEQTINLFQQFTNVGVIAFEEVKGVFVSDSEALKISEKTTKEFLTSDFIGCGFAIRKSVYDTIRGFPVWIDIYGEESCVAIEVLDKGYDILYSNRIKVNHRVNIEERKLQKKNYFRFGKQLKNTTYYFLVYYPFPYVRILKLYWHNFRKYALTDIKCFKIYFRTVFEVLLDFPKILKYRNPVDETLLHKIRNLKSLKF